MARYSRPFLTYGSIGPCCALAEFKNGALKVWSHTQGPSILRDWLAKALGMEDVIGSITPGKKADLVIIDTKAVNMAPIIDPVGAVVCAADISNVRTVFVDGEILKDDFRLKADLTAPRRAVESSRDYLVSKFGDPEPGWLPAKATV